MWYIFSKPTGRHLFMNCFGLSQVDKNSATHVWFVVKELKIQSPTNFTNTSAFYKQYMW